MKSGKEPTRADIKRAVRGRADNGLALFVVQHDDPVALRGGHLDARGRRQAARSQAGPEDGRRTPALCWGWHWRSSTASCIPFASQQRK